MSEHTYEKLKRNKKRITDIFCNAKDTELANNIINIGLNCKIHGDSKVFTSSILI